MVTEPVTNGKPFSKLTRPLSLSGARAAPHAPSFSGARAAPHAPSFSGARAAPHAPSFSGARAAPHALSFSLSGARIAPHARAGARAKHFSRMPGNTSSLPDLGTIRSRSSNKELSHESWRNQADGRFNRTRQTRDASDAPTKIFQPHASDARRLRHPPTKMFQPHASDARRLRHPPQKCFNHTRQTRDASDAPTKIKPRSAKHDHQQALLSRSSSLPAR